MKDIKKIIWHDVEYNLYRQTAGYFSLRDEFMHYGKKTFEIIDREILRNLINKTHDDLENDN